MKIVFICLTTYQLYIAHTICDLLKESDKEIDICIISKRVKCGNYHIRSQYNIIKIDDENNLIKRIFNRFIYTTFLGEVTGKIKLDNKCFTNLIIFNDNEPITKYFMKKVRRKKRNNIILLEEGIGTYYNLGKSNYITHAIVKNKNKFKRDNIKNIIEFDYIKLFSKEKLASFINNTIEPTKIVSCNYDVLILTQPIYENESVYKNELSDTEINYYDKVIEKISKDKAILIKPHPRESILKYKVIEDKYENVKVLDEFMKNIPIECLLPFYNVKNIITMFSSAAINISELYKNISVFFTYEFDELININKLWDKVDIKDFIDNKDNIFILKNTIELSYHINNQENNENLESINYKNLRGINYKLCDDEIQNTINQIIKVIN